MLSIRMVTMGMKSKKYLGVEATEVADWVAKEKVKQE